MFPIFHSVDKHRPGPQFLRNPDWCQKSSIKKTTKPHILIILIFFLIWKELAVVIQIQGSASTQG